MKLIWWLFTAIVTGLFAAVLELNHNTLFGWVLLIVLAGLFIVISLRLGPQGSAWKKLLLWVGYPLCFVGILFLTWPPVRAVPATEGANLKSTGTVTTTYGPVQGVYNSDQSVEVFAGIPYAKPPVGELRWKEPQYPDPWDEVRVCDEFAPMSMQTRNLPIIDSLTRIVGYHDYKISLNDNYREPVSEDSLYLNVWKPAGDADHFPVLVYIHGGSLQTGQPWYEDYSGEGFAKSGVVAVNMGYRLGVFGFYADEELMAESEHHTTGNYGLLDQIKALEWVQENIAQFGGDPNNVTIVGESAGAVCVDALCVSPLAEGLFQKAILESSSLSAEQPPHSFRLLEEALESGNELKQRYGAASVDALRQLSAEELVQEAATQHHVTVDGYALPSTVYELRTNGVHNEQAVIHGYNSEESGPFIIFDHASMKNYEQKIRAYFKEYADEVLAIYPASTDEEADRYWAEIYGAVFFDYSHYCLSRLEQENDVPSWEYHFAKQNGRLGSWHSGELIYAFHQIPEDSRLFDETDRTLSDTMHGYWVNFCKTGDPNGEGLPEFPSIAESGQLLELNTGLREVDHPALALFDILDRMNQN
ncbi:MAG: carboxylesterase family protein [Solobacterium sp.]|nr:carboxylesterase family protein [Solobacterium sp.]